MVRFSLAPHRARLDSADMDPVVTPLPGTATSLSSVPDPVLATGTIGAGVAVIPDAGVEVVQVVAPVSGVARRVAPHMFVIQTQCAEGDDGSDGQPSVFMQLGVDTGRLNGQGFDLHIQEGDIVRQGTPICTYTPRELGRMGFDPIVMVVGLQMGASEIKVDVIPGEPVMGGDNLFWV